MDFPAVETARMTEELVLAKLLTVVRRNDHDGVAQGPSPLQFADQLAHLLIQVCNAVVVSVAGQRDLAGRESQLVGFPEPAQA